MVTPSAIIGQTSGGVFGGANNAAVPMLPSPPPLAHYTLENPWPVAAVCAIVLGTLVWLTTTGRMPGRKWVRPLAWAMLGVGVGVVLGSFWIKTDREALIDHSRTLVAAAAKADTGELSAVLGSEVSLRLLGGETRYSREQSLDLVRKYPGGTTPIDWHKVDRAAAVMDGPDLGRTQVHVRVRSKETTGYDVPIGSWWRIDWRRSGGEWKVTRLECLQIDGVSPGTRP